jgi:hypothetical protein
MAQFRPFLISLESSADRRSVERGKIDPDRPGIDADHVAFLGSGQERGGDGKEGEAEEFCHGHRLSNFFM